MVFKRKLYDRLIQWKNDNAGTALLIEGSRRVGKTTLAEDFAKREFPDYLLLDFSKTSQDIKDLFSLDLNDLDEFFARLFILTRHVLKPGSLIIFDEIQRFPAAREAIKSLVADPKKRFRYLESGSLIGISELDPDDVGKGEKAMGDIVIPSEEESVTLRPMDYEEYRWAKGDEGTVPLLRTYFEAKKSLGEKENLSEMRDYYAYLAIGGMPQAVAAYLQEGTFQAADRAKRNILELYEKDLVRYDNKYGTVSAPLFRSIPWFLTSHRVAFPLSKLGMRRDAKTLTHSIQLLEESQFATFVRNVADPNVGMGLSEDPFAFKMYLCDTGLLISQILKDDAKTGEAVYQGLISGKLAINKGMIFENAVCQTLVGGGHHPHYHSFYVTSDPEGRHLYEVDFLIADGYKLDAIEVKSSSTQAHSSIDKFVAKYPSRIKERLIIGKGDLKQEGDYLHLPLYMTMFL